MGQEIKLEVTRRKEGTKGDINSLRKEGFIPGVVYGGDEPPFSISVNKKMFLKVLHNEKGSHAVFALTINHDKPEIAMIKDHQVDKVTDEIIHLDFQRISLKEKIEVEVEFKIEGEASGVKKGGVLGMPTHAVRISCLPTQIPAHIPVEVESLEIGDSIHLKDISFPKEVTVLTDPESVVVTISAPQEEEVPEEVVPEESAAEPEVIGKGKKEEEGQVSEEKK